MHLDLDLARLEEQKTALAWFGARRAVSVAGERTMTPSHTLKRLTNQPLPWFQVRIWNLALLILFVAIAIADIQDQGQREPELIALAAVGFAGYGLVGWLGWLWVRRFEAKLGSTLLLVLYMIAMAAFFVFSTIVYLVVEYAYLNGHFAHVWVILRGLM
jgi:hypothetical protein